MIQFQKNNDKAFNQFRFDSENSQEGNEDDKQFSPWIRKKTKKVDTNQIKKFNHHKFLDSIEFKHRKNQSQSLDHGNELSDKNDLNELQTQKKEAKLHNQFDLIQVNKVGEKKQVFQKRSHLNPLQEKPKYIDLTLDFDPNRVLKYSSLGISAGQMPKRQEHHQGVFFRKKKQFREKEAISKTIRQLESEYSKFYKTIDRKIYPLEYPKRAYESISTPIQQEEKTKNMSLHSRSKPMSKAVSRDKSNPISQLACEGKNFGMTTYGGFRRERLKKQFMKQKQMRQIIFLK